MPLVARTRDIAAQINRLRARQISFARHCRTQAALVRTSAEHSKSSEVRETMLALALNYEQIADSVEQYTRRFLQTSADAGWVTNWKSPSQTTRRGRQSG